MLLYFLLVAVAWGLDCGIWLAPSTIPGGGLGMFAGKNFDKGDLLLGDIVIPVVDMVAHNMDQFTFLWDEYTWKGSSLGMGREGIQIVSGASPGFPSVANSVPPLVNVDIQETRYDSVGLDRRNDPGAGAISYYCNRTAVASRSINRGQEFFVDYGSSWFKARPSLGAIPLHRDLEYGTKVYKAFQRLEKQLEKYPGVADDVWKQFLVHHNFNQSRTLGGLNFDDPNERKELAKNKSLTEIRIEQSYRTDQWLEEHGACADHLMVQKSTLPQAGWGAFARRNIPKGTVVAQVPLIHVPQRKRLNMYKIGRTEGREQPDSSLGSQGKQLLLNYCFGHRHTTMLLCPYGPMVNYMNHNRFRRNIKLQWADLNKSNHNSTLLEMSIDNIEKSSGKAMLAMEVVADTDIDAGDEIFLDYGEDWENAWNNHVESWTPTGGSETYQSAEHLNAKIDQHLRTVFETLREPFPPNVELRCNEAYTTSKWEQILRDDNHTAILEFLNEVNERGRGWFDCEILSEPPAGRESEEMYKAVLYKIEDQSNKADRNDLIKRIPREGFKFVDRPYTTDMFQRNVFRQPIGIPELLLPKTWRNVH